MNVDQSCRQHTRMDIGPSSKKKNNRGRSGKIMIAFMGAFSYGRKTFEREGATK